MEYLDPPPPVAVTTLDQVLQHLGGAYGNDRLPLTSGTLKSLNG